eukprot:632070-Rhodomonas_salina.1
MRHPPRVVPASSFYRALSSTSTLPCSCSCSCSCSSLAVLGVVSGTQMLCLCASGVGLAGVVHDGVEELRVREEELHRRRELEEQRAVLVARFAAQPPVLVQAGHHLLVRHSVAAGTGRWRAEALCFEIRYTFFQQFLIAWGHGTLSGDARHAGHASPDATESESLQVTSHRAAVTSQPVRVTSHCTMVTSQRLANHADKSFGSMGTIGASSRHTLGQIYHVTGFHVTLSFSLITDFLGLTLRITSQPRNSSGA